MTTNTPHSDHVTDIDISYLIKTLNDMHAELAKTSLMLKDYRDYLDSVRSSAEAVIALSLIGEVPNPVI